MGRRLLKALGIGLDRLDHRNFEQARAWIEANGEDAFKHSVNDVEAATEALYGKREISPQQLSATFRRGDLIQRLLEMDI